LFALWGSQFHPEVQVVNKLFKIIVQISEGREKYRGVEGEREREREQLTMLVHTKL
jgi:hypothetical protein